MNKKLNNIGPTYNLKMYSIQQRSPIETVLNADGYKVTLMNM